MRWETVATNIRFWARQPYTSRKVSNILSSCHRKSHVIKLRPCASRNDVGIYVTIRTLLWYLRSSLKIKCNFKGLRWQILNKNMSSSSLHTHQHKAHTFYLCTRAKCKLFFFNCAPNCTQFQSILLLQYSRNSDRFIKRCETTPVTCTQLRLAILQLLLAVFQLCKF